MQHLHTERLAALDYEPATSDELAHLASCAPCRAERDAYAALAALASQEAMSPAHASTARLIEWNDLAVQLRAEGLLSSAQTAPNIEPVLVRSIDGQTKEHAIPDVAAVASAKAETPVVVSHARRSRFATPFLRAAAAAVFMIGGAMLGRLSAGANAIPDYSPSAVLNNASIATTSWLTGAESFASVDQATSVLERAQRDYERASLWLATNDTTKRSEAVYRARLAALEQMMTASRAALRDAPQDPVLNHYYLSAYSAREATLQQLSSALPVDKTLEGY